MLVVADKAFFNAQVVEQLQTDPGIFCGNKVGLFQSFPAALGNIPQIADGGGDKV